MADDKDFLDDLAQQLRCQKVPVFPRDSVLELMSEKTSVGYQPNQPLKTNIMKHPFQLAAAVIVIVIAAGLLWKIGPFTSTTSFAMEQVLNAVEQSRSVSYTFTTYGWEGNPWPDPYVRKISILAPGRSRTEIDGEVQIMNAKQGRHTIVHQKEKKVVIRPFYQSSSGIISPVDEFLQQLRNPSKGSEKKTHKRDDDGHSIVEFRRKFDGDDWIVTVDATTKLPIRMEIARGKRQGKQIREVMSDFVFDAPMEESLFEAVVPDGFSVEERVADITNKSYPTGDAETLIASPGRLGPVRSGMTTGEIIQVLGKPDWIGKREIMASPVPHPGAAGSKKSLIETLEYDSRGFTLTIGPHEHLAISCYSQVTRGPLVRDFVGRTKEGIQLGATREKVLEVYGQPESEQGSSLQYLELGWQFFLRENKICGFHTSRPMPKRRADGVQTRVLKDGTILQTAPGVDIDAMLDSDGNLKKSKK